jgi:hypothetical protein
MRLMWIGGVLCLVAEPALAQSMSADAFYQRATKLQAKGMMAMLARGEIAALTAEVQGASGRANELRKAALAAGRKPRFCPPAGGKAAIGSKELLGTLAAIPPADRARIDTTEAMTRLFAAKFPC